MEPMAFDLTTKPRAAVSCFQHSGNGDNGDTKVDEKEREELKNALIAAQESAAIQLLLEACLYVGKVSK